MEYYCGCVGKFTPEELTANPMRTTDWFEAFSENFPPRLKSLFQLPSGPAYICARSLHLSRDACTIPGLLLWTPMDKEFPCYTFGYLRTFIDVSGEEVFRLCFVLIPENTYKERYHYHPFHLFRSDFLKKIWELGRELQHLPKLPAPQPLPEVSEQTQELIKKAYEEPLSTGEKITLPYHYLQWPQIYGIIESIYSTLPEEAKDLTFVGISNAEPSQDFSIVGVLSEQHEEKWDIFGNYSPLSGLAFSGEVSISDAVEKIAVAAPLKSPASTDYFELPTGKSATKVSPPKTKKPAMPKIEKATTKSQSPAAKSEFTTGYMDLPDYLDVQRTKPLAASSGPGIKILPKKIALKYVIALIVLVAVAIVPFMINKIDQAAIDRINLVLSIRKGFQERLQVAVEELTLQQRDVPMANVLREIAAYQVVDREKSKEFWQTVANDKLFKIYPNARQCLSLLLQREQQQVLEKYQNGDDSFVEVKKIVTELDAWHEHWQQVGQQVGSEITVVPSFSRMKKEYEANLRQQRNRRLVTMPLPELVKVPKEQIPENLLAAFDEKVSKEMKGSWRLPAVATAAKEIALAENARDRFTQLGKNSADFLQLWEPVVSSSFGKSQKFYQECVAERQKWSEELEKFTADVQKHRSNVPTLTKLQHFNNAAIDYVKVSPQTFTAMLTLYEELFSKQFKAFEDIENSLRTTTKISELQKLANMFRFPEQGFTYFAEEPTATESFREIYRQRKQQVVALQRKMEEQLDKYRQKHQRLMAEIQDFVAAWEKLLSESAGHQPISLASWPRSPFFSDVLQQKLYSFLLWLKEEPKQRRSPEEWADVFDGEFLTYLRCFQHIDANGVTPSYVSAVQQLDLGDQKWYIVYLVWLKNEIIRHLDNEHRKATIEWQSNWWKNPAQVEKQLQTWHEQLAKWKTVLGSPLKLVPHAEKLEQELSLVQQKLQKLQSIAGERNGKWWLGEQVLFDEGIGRIKRELQIFEQRTMKHESNEVSPFIEFLEKRLEILNSARDELQKVLDVSAEAMQDRIRTRLQSVADLLQVLAGKMAFFQRVRKLVETYSLENFALKEIAQIDKLAVKYEKLALFRNDFAANFAQIAIHLHKSQSAILDEKGKRDLSTKVYQRFPILQKIPAYRERHGKLTALLQKSQSVYKILPALPELTIRPAELDTLLEWCRPYQKNPSFLRIPAKKVRQYLFANFAKYTQRVVQIYVEENDVTQIYRTIQDNEQRQAIEEFRRQGVLLARSQIPENLPAPLREFLAKKQQELAAMRFSVRCIVFGGMSFNARQVVTMNGLQFHIAGTTSRAKINDAVLSFTNKLLGYATIEWFPFRSDELYAETPSILGGKHAFDNWPFMSTTKIKIQDSSVSLWVMPVEILTEKKEQSSQR